MPLDTEGEGMVHDFDGFGDTVAGAGSDFDLSACVADTLMMEGIDFYLMGAEDFGESALGTNGDAVAWEMSW